MCQPDSSDKHRIDLPSHGNLCRQRIHVCLACLLGNCLRNVASIKILADHIGAEWDIDFARSTALPELNAIIQQLFPGRVAQHPPDSYSLIPEDELLQFVDILGTNSHPVVEATISEVPTYDFGVRHIYAIRPRSMTDADYIQRKISFYNKEVLWPDHLLKDIDNFIQKEIGGFALANFVGCHIRYTDNLRDELKCRLNLNTSLSTFIDRLRLLDEQPIFLCTDNPEVRNIVIDALPHANILVPTICSNNPVLWQPLYEMLLLAKTRYLIGSQSSTFSYEACFINGIDLEVFRDGAWRVYPISQVRR
jgi:hypothetical protein